MKFIFPIWLALVLFAVVMGLQPGPTSPYTSEGHRRLNPEMFDPRPMAK
jgi:hypothetical protein